MKILFIGAGKMGFPIMSSWVTNKKKKSIDIYIVEKNRTNIHKIKKNNLKVKIFNQIPDSWEGDIIFLLLNLKILKR